MAKLDQDTLLKLYDVVVQEEHYFLDAYHARVAFYAKVVLGIIAATVIGVYLTSLSSLWYHFAALCAGPVLVYAMSAIARDGCYRLYRRYLEAVTSRAKIEQELMLSYPRPEADAGEDAYWATEPFVAPRHVTGRKRYRSSEEFIRSSMRRGSHRWTERLFRGFEVFSGVAFVGLLFLTVLQATQSLTPAEVLPAEEVAPLVQPPPPLEIQPEPDIP